MITKIAFCDYCRKELDKNEIDFHKSCLDSVNEYIDKMSEPLRIKYKVTGLEAEVDYTIITTENSQRPSEAEVTSITITGLKVGTDYIIYSNKDD